MPNKAKAVLCGLGWSVKIQLPCFNAADLHVTGLIARNSIKLQQQTQQYKVNGYSNLNEALKSSSETTLFTVTTPPVTHLPYVTLILNAHKHCLCEKPFALSNQQAEQMVQLANQINQQRRLQGKPPLLTLVDYELRTLQCVQKARSFLSDTRFGALQQIHCNFLGPLFVQDKYNWWCEKSEGGGMLGAIGTHLIDLVRFCTGKEFIRVSAQLTAIQKTRPHDGDIQRPVSSDDYCSLRAELNTDVHLTMTLSGLVTGHLDKTILFISNKGTLILDLHQLTLKFYTYQNNESLVELLCDGEDFKNNPLAAGVPTNAFSVGTLLIGRNIKQAIESQQEAPRFLATFEDGLEVQRVQDAAHRSNYQQGMWQNVGP